MSDSFDFEQVFHPDAQVRRKKKRRVAIGGAACVLAVILLAVAAAVWIPWGEDQPRETETAQSSATESTPVQTTAETEPALTFEEVSLKSYEVYSYSYIFSGTVYQTELDGNLYQFSSDISDIGRASFIASQQSILSLIPQISGVSFRVLYDYPNRCDSEAAAGYFDIMKLNTWEQVLTTLQLCYGQSVNYGYVYAMANDIAARLGWETDGSSAAPEVFREQPEMLNLVYPCFMDMFCDEVQISAAKALSIELYSRMEDPFAGEEAYMCQIEAYAQEQGIEFTPTDVRFWYCGENCPLRFETDHLTVSIDNTFEQDLAVEGGYALDWTRSVAALLNEAQLRDRQIGVYREALPYGGDEKIPVRLNSDETGYYRNYKSINATSMQAIPYYYGYYLYFLANPEYSNADAWMAEALNSYYYSEIWLERRQVMVENGSSNMKMEDFHGVGMLTDFSQMVEYWENKYRENPEPSIVNSLRKGSNDAACSFTAYLVANYGEENMKTILLWPSTAVELTGKTMDGLLEEWSSYIYE